MNRLRIIADTYRTNPLLLARVVLTWAVLVAVATQ